jgi:hypothetical protein
VGCIIGLTVQETGTPTSGPTAGEERTRSYVEHCYSTYDELITKSVAPYMIA